MARLLNRLLAGTALGLVLFYRAVLSPLKVFFFGPSAGCRFHPSCSAYCAECLRRFSLPRALYLATRRLLRCHPFHPGGDDPVPDSGPV